MWLVSGLCSEPGNTMLNSIMQMVWRLWNIPYQQLCEFWDGVAGLNWWKLKFIKVIGIASLILMWETVEVIFMSLHLSTAYMHCLW
jgi:hypothetical protein